MNKNVRRLISVLLIAVMVGISQALHNPEIIFPEIGAIACGCLVAPRLSWKVDPLRIMIMVMGGAIIGMGIVHFIHMPVFYEVIIAYVLAQFLLLLSQTTFAPMISAIVLPVMLQTRSISYLFSAFVFTGLILVVYVFSRKNKPNIHYTSRLNRGEMIALCKRSLFSLFGITFAFLVDARFAAAPPLLVAFTELSSPHAQARKRPLAVILLVFFSALIGAGIRYLLSVCLAVPLAFPALFTGGMIFWMMDHLKLYLPPAAAVGVLAMLIPSQVLPVYPFEILAGISVIMFLCLHFFRSE